MASWASSCGSFRTRRYRRFLEVSDWTEVDALSFTPKKLSKF